MAFSHSPTRSPVGSDLFDLSEPFANPPPLVSPELRKCVSFANLQDELRAAMKDERSVDDTTSDEEDEEEQIGEVELDLSSPRAGIAPALPFIMPTTRPPVPRLGPSLTIQIPDETTGECSPNVSPLLKVEQVAHEKDHEKAASDHGSLSFIAGSDHLDVKGKGKASDDNDQISDEGSYLAGSDHIDVKDKANSSNDDLFALFGATSPSRKVFDPLHLLNRETTREPLPIKHVKVSKPIISQASPFSSQVASLHDSSDEPEEEDDRNLFSDGAVVQEGAVRSVEIVSPEEDRFPQGFSAVIEDPFDDSHSAESEDLTIPATAACFSEPGPSAAAAAAAAATSLAAPVENPVNAEDIPLQTLSPRRASLESIDLTLPELTLQDIPAPTTSAQALREHRSEAENYLAQARQAAGLNSRTGSPLELESGSGRGQVVRPWYRRTWAYVWFLGMILCAVFLGVLISVIVERQKGE